MKRKKKALKPRQCQPAGFPLTLTQEEEEAEDEGEARGREREGNGAIRGIMFK